MKGKLSTLIAVAVILSLLGAACAPAATPTPKPVEKVFKLGVLGPFTGPAARTGEEIKNGYIMAFDAIGYKVGDYKIEFVYIDSQSDPAKATTAYEEAIVRDKIQAGAGGWHSSVSVACMEVTAKYKLPHFFSAGETNVVSEKFRSDMDKYGYWMAKGWPMPQALVSKTYAVAFDDFVQAGVWPADKKTIAISCEDTDFGRAVGGPLNQYLTDRGWEILAEDYFPLEETEFYPLLTKYKNSGADVVIVTDTAAAGISAFTKQAKEIGLEALLIGHGLGWIGEWYELTGDASDYALDQIPQLASPESRAWATEFENKWGFKASPSAAGLAYDWANFLIKIMEATIKEYGEMTSETLYKFGREKLWTGQFTYTDGIIMPRYRFSMESIPDPVVGKEDFLFPVIQYFSGKGVIVWPFDWKEADLKIPPWVK
ncbi:MAG: ABC transporter substrate-binding protein [Anaerolineales bacterium]|nr:ABC transporter substrate-binding protein [Anaerolineales bacterium]